MRRAIAALVLLVAGIPTPASAQFHSMMIREVYPGIDATVGGDFIELQMYQGGQTLLNGHSITVYPQAGTGTTISFTHNVDNGSNQARILIADVGMGGNFDLTVSIDPAGGAVCFEDIDCVAWGNFSGSTPAPSQVGANESASGIPPGNSIERNISPGCATALDNPADDTNDSEADFVTNAMPTGTPNSATPTETLCPGGGAGGDGDLAPPVTTIDRPKQGRTYAPAKLRTLRGAAADNSGSVVEVDLALRKKMVSGACRWWNGSGFVKRACSARLFFDAAGQGSWTYHLPSKLASSVGTKVASYTLYARSRDAAGNLEPLFTKGRNANRFEIAAPA